jgi:hypothetical protein
MMHRLWGTVLVIGLAFCLTGCHLRTYQYTDAEHRVTISYPGQVSLLNDPALLDKTFGLAAPTPGETPKLAFALQAGQSSTATCVVQSVPGKAEFTPDTYFDATTARELALAGAEIVESRSEIDINGKTFQQIGFLLKGDRSARSRIYEYYDPASRRVLVFSVITKPEDWEVEAPTLEAIARSLKLDW